MKNMNKDTMGKFSHPIGLDIEHYKEMKKLVDTYGEDFLEHIDPDGRVRTRFNQILVTGRVSSMEPNMQQIPAKELTQTNNGKGQRYRNCFKPPVGCKFVSSDFVSQELGIIAHITQDKLWIQAIRKNQDLHSTASELVFGNEKNPFHISWKNAADKDCAYYKLVVGENGKMEHAKKKCSCPRHKVMRDACKSINFGLAYGMTEYRLAAMLRITVSEARNLIRDYFIAMPAIGKTMTALGRYGMRNGFIKTLAPFFRKRWFPEWNGRKQFYDEHVAGIRPDRFLGEIDKASKNQPIQGTGADMTKLAICMVMWELDEKDLHDIVKLVLQVHDQLDTVCKDQHVDIWKLRLTEIMEEAARVVIPSGLVRAETSITDVWSK
jgi:DNA polymerase-1